MKPSWSLFRSFIAFIGTLGLISAPVTAGDLEAFRKCTNLENHIERLQCFDAAAADLPVAEQKTPGSVEDGSEGAKPDEAKPLPGTPQAPARLDPSQIKDADEAMVEGCEFLGIVVGKSGWGGLAAGAANKGTMRSAKKKAAKMGATHIVFGDFDNASGMKVSTRQARAYRCLGAANSTQPTPNPTDGADG